jgi:hypothetical protein
MFLNALAFLKRTAKVGGRNELSKSLTKNILSNIDC